MASLLSLPRELRDIIIDEVVTSERRSPPIASNDKDFGGGERTQFEDTYWKEVGNLIYFEKRASAFQPTFGGLLLTCRQLRTETLERASKADVPYVLDLLIVNEEKIWATWLLMPATRPSMIENLKINVRMQCDGYDWTRDWEGSPKTDNFTLVFGTQLRNLLYRILAVGCAAALPDENRRSLWHGARYKFKDTIRFEHEYVPHYCIRKLEFHFAGYIQSDGGWGAGPRPCLMDKYINEWKEVVDELAGHNIVFQGRKHPGWRLVPERIGGIVMFLGKSMYSGEWRDLSTQYMLYAGEYPGMAVPCSEILGIRNDHGL
ncbi:hypothetical protein BU23DRAFT_558405 [Bimuria novae-zelandiae CBS 107.79]|uniref:F-box domain-containing protein n=1 Tax=Bimuria novae-zelandiae CBS 107.79 TaxID=1447943 RepID=A0A6A5UUV0_9PLEO|nr:hypothetical protein BU23DRAFT_558405 [Bimuria novae-zelandiae CBS 107.79]